MVERVFLAGGSGAIGVRLIPLLVADGYEVTAMTRSPQKVPLLARLGADVVVCDVFDRVALHEAVTTSAPSIVVHQLTDLPDDQSKIPERGAANTRMRLDGTDNLVSAATAVGVSRLLAQSVAWQLPEPGARAVAHLEDAVLGVGGTVLRYGRWYGPGTYSESAEPPPPRIHIDAAARSTIEALAKPPGLYTAMEDENGRPEVRPA